MVTTYLTTQLTKHGDYHEFTAMLVVHPVTVKDNVHGTLK